MKIGIVLGVVLAVSLGLRCAAEEEEIYERLVNVAGVNIDVDDTLWLQLQIGEGAEAGDRVVLRRGYDPSETFKGWKSATPLAKLKSGAGEELEAKPVRGYGVSWRYGKIYVIKPDGSIRGESELMERHCEPRGEISRIVADGSEATMEFVLGDHGSQSSKTDVYVSCVETGRPHSDHAKRNREPLAVGVPCRIPLTDLPRDSEAEVSLLLVNEHSHTGRMVCAFTTKPVAAFGGDVITNALDASGDKVHVFTKVGQSVFNMPEDCGATVEYLIVGGGGGGGAYGANGGAGGGGGGGSVVTGRVCVAAGESVRITVGGGGASSARGGDSLLALGEDKEGLRAFGGGGGSGRGWNPTTGGNGGGAGGRSRGTGAAGVQQAGGGWFCGHRGGNASDGWDGGGGGGGAGADGENAGEIDGVRRGGRGGDGVASRITGRESWYGGGGGGGAGEGSSNSSSQPGGKGGGGASANGGGGPGAPNTGGGGGGVNGYNDGAVGGSGVVILRYSPLKRMPAPRSSNRR